MAIEKGIPHGALVLVADHSKALLLRNNGPALSPNLELLDTIEADANPPTRDQGTDKPGRAAMGTHRSAMGQTDWHAQAKAEFSVRAADLVSEGCQRYEAGSVVIVAPPRALSELREALPEQVRSLIAFEVDKDLVNMPVKDISKHLSS